MSIDNALASVAVKTLSAAVPWYEALLGRPPDSTPMPEVAERKFAGGGWVQVYQLPERAGSGSFTLAVSNIEELVTHAKGLGIDASQRSSSDWKELFQGVFHQSFGKVVKDDACSWV